MGAVTFTVLGTAFAALAQSAGRKALDCDPGYPRQRAFRFHLPGTDGNLKILAGTRGREIRCVARYIAADVSTCLGYIATDRAAWSNAEGSVIDDEGTTHTRCTVRSVRRMGRTRSTGRSLVRQDVEIIVDVDS
jgi:hypothetical protein